MFADPLVFALTLAATLGCALVGGIFFAFSTFIMRALARIAPDAGIAAMQAINVTVLTPWFMGAFFGTGVLCVAALVHAFDRWGEAGALLRGAGGAVYLVGTIGVTIACNVPRNDRLAGLPPADPGSERDWRDYVGGWTAWNHVRTVASMVAAALFGLALGA